MLTKLNTPFKFIEDYFEDYGNKSTSIASSNSSYLEKGSNSPEIGLQTLIQTSSAVNSNVVLKISIKKSASTAMESCFLKSCFLCNKNLSLDKDIYMYRGDKGFCSIECRSRQIYLDEINEIEEEASTKKKFRTSYKYNKYCSSSGHHETRLLLEELRRRNNPVTITPHQNHWAIVS